MHTRLRDFLAAATVFAPAVVVLPAGAAAHAQKKLCPCPPPSPPPPAWTGSLGGGLSLTGGNSDTSSYNLDFALTYDPKKKGLLKLDGSYLRTASHGEPTVDRTGLGARYEYTVAGGGRLFAFAEVRYQRDLFKDVDHLISPTAGAGYRLADRDDLKLSVDGGVGLAFEKLTGLDATTSGAVDVGESLSWKLSGNASLVNAARGLWKTDDFGDAYYHFDVGVLTSLAGHFDLKLTFADDYKTKPPADKKKNDTTFLATIVFKI
jgi:putative salt-induced outer membrane protein YdiY